MKGKIFEFAMKHPIVTLFIASDLCTMVVNCVSIVKTGHGPNYSRRYVSDKGNTVVETDGNITEDDLDEDKEE